MAWPGYPAYDYGYYDHSSCYDQMDRSLQPGMPYQQVDGYRNDDDESSHEADHEELRQRYSYCLNFFNPSKRSKYTFEKLRRHDTFKSPKELRECLKANYKNLVSDRDDFEIGYKNGHRGSAKIWIKDSEDLDNMYKNYDKPDKQEIVIWCEGKSDVTESSTRKRRTADTSDSVEKPKSKRQAIQDEVDDIFLELKESHGSQYTPAQYRLWANMVQVGTHDDYESPPKVPMFGAAGKVSSRGTSVSEALTSVAEGVMRVLKSPEQSSCCCPKPRRSERVSSNSPTSLVEKGVSPLKCAALRSQYIQQLKELHQLLELTAITKEEYEQQKNSILEKMKDL